MRYRVGVYREIERIGELFGVKDQDIPAFVTAIESVTRTRESVEDWHGQVPTNRC